MLKLKIGNSFVDAKDLEIPVVLRSSLFDNKGSYLFNFSLPATDMLRKEFGFFHRPSRGGPSHISRPLELSFGKLKFAGLANISQASSEVYEVSCPIDSGNLASLFKTKKLADIDLGGLRTMSLAPVRANAKTDHDLVVSLTFENPITYPLPIPFENIILNPLGELDIEGLSFTSTVNTTVSFMFTMDTWNNTSNSAQLRIFLNGAESGFAYISNYQHSSFEIELIEGDVVTWDVLLESLQINETESQIDFTVYTGSTLLILLPVDEMSQNGTFLYPGNDYASFPVENPKFFDNIEDDTYQVDNVSFKETYSKYFPVLNYYLNNRFPVAMSGMSEGQVFSTFNVFTPFPFLAYFIKRMARDLGISISNNVFENPDLNQLVIFNAFSENNLVSNDLIVPSYGFDLADHLPDMQLSEYWLNLCSLLGIAWEYRSSDKTLSLANLEDIMKDTAFIDFPGTVRPNPELQASFFNGYSLKQEHSNDSYIGDNFRSLDGLTLKGSVTFWNQLSGITDQQINDCYYVTMRHEYYIWNYDKELGCLNWIFHSKDFFFTMGSSDPAQTEQPLEISSKLTPIMLNGYDLLDHNLCAPTFRHWLIPVTHQAGNFEGLPDYFKSEFSTSLLFYRGLQYDSQGKLYPLGTPDVYNYAGERVVTEGHEATLSLRWDGEFGLYNNRYNKWIDFRLKSPGTWEFRASMTPMQIAGISFLKWYTIQGHRYLIKEMNFNIYNDHISEVKLQAVSR
ncbi:MAG: hypothetical protein AB9834_09975 [Lentimicrobium sp.]